VLGEGAVVGGINLGFFRGPERLSDEARDERTAAFTRPRQKLIDSDQEFGRHTDRQFGAGHIAEHT
jgi:hypothetical protein